MQDIMDKPAFESTRVIPAIQNHLWFLYIYSDAMLLLEIAFQSGKGVWNEMYGFSVYTGFRIRDSTRAHNPIWALGPDSMKDGVSPQYEISFRK